MLFQRKDKEIFVVCKNHGKHKFFMEFHTEEYKEYKKYNKKFCLFCIVDLISLKTNFENMKGSKK